MRVFLTAAHVEVIVTMVTMATRGNSSKSADLLDEELAVEELRHLETLTDTAEITGPVAEGLGDLARKTVRSVTAGELSVGTATLLLREIFNLANFTGRNFPENQIVYETVKAVVEELPEGGPVSHEVYESLCLPIPFVSGYPYRTMLLETGMDAGHSWPQAVEILGGQASKSSSILNYWYVENQQAPADYTYRAWAWFLESLDPQLRDALVPLAAISNLQGLDLVRGACEALGLSQDTVEVSPVTAYAQTTGIKPLKPFEDVTGKGERILTWCENPNNGGLPSFGVRARWALRELRFIVWELDDWFTDQNVRDFPEGFTLPDVRNWNFQAGSWAGRVLSLAQAFPEHQALWSQEMLYTSQALAGENILAAPDGVRLVAERSMRVAGLIPTGLDEATRAFLSAYGMGMLPTGGQHEDVRADTGFAFMLLERIYPEGAKPLEEKLLLQDNFHLATSLLTLLLALNSGEEEYVKAARALADAN